MFKMNLESNNGSMLFCSFEMVVFFQLLQRILGDKKYIKILCSFPGPRTSRLSSYHTAVAVS